MAVRLVNKSKADCDISTYGGRAVRLRPSSYITLDEPVTKSCIEYYRQLSDLGLYLEKEPEAKVEEVVNSTEDEQIGSNEVGKDESLDSSEEVGTEEGDTTEDDSSESEENSDEENVDSTEDKEPEVTVDELVAYTKPQLIEMGAAYGLEGLEALSKKQIATKIIEVSSGKQ